MNESLYDNIVNYILHKEYPSECKKVDKYVLRRTAKKYSVEITPANKDDSRVGEGRPILWFVGKGKKLLVIKGEQEKKRVFLECHASNYGGQKWHLVTNAGNGFMQVVKTSPTKCFGTKWSGGSVQIVDYLFT